MAERRNSLNKTQEQVAQQVGLSRASLANIERGRQRVFLHQILAITEALELPSSHEIIPARSVSIGTDATSGMTMSGAKKLSRDQKMLVNRIVGSITAGGGQGKR